MPRHLPPCQTMSFVLHMLTYLCRSPSTHSFLDRPGMLAKNLWDDKLVAPLRLIPSQTRSQLNRCLSLMKMFVNGQLSPQNLLLLTIPGQWMCFTNDLSWLLRRLFILSLSDCRDSWENTTCPYSVPGMGNYYACTVHRHFLIDHFLSELDQERPPQFNS